MPRWGDNYQLFGFLNKLLAQPGHFFTMDDSGVGWFDEPRLFLVEINQINIEDEDLSEFDGLLQF